MENHLIFVTSDTARLQNFLTDPTEFDQLITDAENEVDCYTNLRDEAKKSLSSFDEYIDFYAASIEEGPTGFVIHDLKRNAIRSLKNMVLRSSRAGKQFPITSAAELERRAEAFHDLGVDAATSRPVVFTILEHIFDEDEHNAHAYEIIDHLLTETPDTSSKFVGLLVRARFVLATETINSDSPAIHTHFQELSRDLPDNLQDDDRSASELVEAAREKSYANSYKIELIQASLARSGGEEVLEEFLYLSARDVVERYRHQNREDPQRGELQLTLRQFNCLENLDFQSWSNRRGIRSKSYRQLVLGQLKSGGGWRSQRDPADLPDSNFFSAASRYFQAANMIESVDAHRYIKYLSMSFRHLSNAVQIQEFGPGRGWATSRVIHDRAIDVLTSAINEEHTEDRDELADTILGAVATHKFRRHQAAAVAAFERGEPEATFEQADEAWEHLDATPTYENTDLLERIDNLAEALLFEAQGEFNEALDQYQESEGAKLNIQKRISLVKIKRDIDQLNYESALSEALATFDDSSPVVTAVQLIAGKPPSSPSVQPPVFEELSAIDPETVWSFAMTTYLHSKSDELSDIAKEDIKKLLLKL